MQHGIWAAVGEIGRVIGIGIGEAVIRMEAGDLVNALKAAVGQVPAKREKPTTINGFLETYKSEKEIRQAGKLRVEGKAYVMQDGDVVEFRFNV